ncbi:hypothetical protein PHMEG_00023001 [Phytophthora megakarya]|uniref:Uncharacterized protein n=1 Tax=Phytophthora megakarya TaxID=4795 RepID=A0A225VI23_9STRA|nr:hypothetical protein PHMEG_00023001 [Phytophthora megakarya]
MGPAVCVANNQPSANVHRSQEDIAPRQSLASRMIRLIFKKKRRITEQRAKSWSAYPEPVPVPIPTENTCHSNSTIAISNSLASSAPCTIPTACTKPQQICKRAMRSNCGGAHWRQRQTYCANCEGLFFTSLSTLRIDQDRFCSLDCKTNFEYMIHLHDAMDEHMLGASFTSSGLFEEDAVGSEVLRGVAYVHRS